MKYLKEVSQDKRDYIKLCVGSSQTFLGAIKLHKTYNGILRILTKELEGLYDVEIKVLLNAIINAIKDEDQGTYLTRNQKYYSYINKELSLKRNKCISATRMTRLVAELEVLGYLECYIGYKDVSSDKSMSSCILFTSKLLTFFTNINLNYASRIKQRYVEVRDVDKLPKKGVRGIVGLEKEVEEVDTWIRSHEIRFGLVKKNLRLQQVFAEDLDSSGRLYFGALQTIKSYKRRLIQINGLLCCECDYSSQHLRICATLEGVHLPKDFKPYDVDISDLVTAKDNYEVRARLLIKFAIMMLLNSGNASAALRTSWKNNIIVVSDAIEKGKWAKAKENPFYGLSGIKNIPEIIKRIRKHNSYAEEYFKCKEGAWKLLQNLDGKIMMYILKDLKCKGVCAIPYHDGAIVQSMHKETLIKSMIDAWGEILGDSHNAVVDVKWDMSKCEEEKE